jgi:hypothetical protein
MISYVIIVNDLESYAGGIRFHAFKIEDTLSNLCTSLLSPQLLEDVKKGLSCAP